MENNNSNKSNSKIKYIILIAILILTIIIIISLIVLLILSISSSGEKADDIEQAILSSIQILNMPDKMKYKEGEIFDKKGLVINAIFSDKTLAKTA